MVLSRVSRAFRAVTRQLASRQGAVLLLLLTMTLTVPAGASAAPSLALSRATLQIGGQMLTLDVLVPANRVRTVTGPIAVTVLLPRGVAGALLGVDGGLNGQGWNVTFRPAGSAQAVMVSVTVPARAIFTTEVDISSEAGWAYGVPGYANAATRIRLTL